MFIFASTKQLPKPLQSYIRKYYLIGIVFLLISIILLFIPTFRGAVPLSLLLSLANVVMGYLAERAIAKKGYVVKSYYVEQYTSRFGSKVDLDGPWHKKVAIGDGVFSGKGAIKGLDLRSVNPLDDKIYHLGVPNDRHVPQIGWIVDIYSRSKSEPIFINGKYYITEFYTRSCRAGNLENNEESVENN